ncbi:MAG: MATE family efflux transporter, partial [Clostridiales bacterium]|nr:MATE family efflux transporter [Clostridiales bacterium]
MTEDKHDFSKGSLWKIILSQALPMTAAQMIQLLYNIVDRIYIGHMPETGHLALTGVGLTFPFVTFILAFASLFNTGGTPLFSLSRGRKDEKAANEIMGNVFAMILLFSVVIFLACWLLRKPVLYLFGASEVTFPYAESYLKIYLFGTLFSMTATGMNGFINAQGFPKTAMMTTVIGAVINLILDPILIFGAGLGIKGAALATVISQGISAVWVVKFLTGKKSILPLKISHIKINLHTAARITGLGITGFMQQATNCLVQIICNATLQNYGGDVYVGIMTIVNSVREVASLPVIGLTNGAQPVLGFNSGAGENRLVKEGIKFISLAGILYTAVFWVIIMFLPEVFIKIFSDDIQTLNLGVKAVRLYFVGFIFMSLQFVGQSAFISLGRAKSAVFFSILRKVVIVCPLVILLPMLINPGTDGVF